ncbi:MAG TPA: V-type ATP synthase subunit E [archaeon]|nr:V-type ATP synthase subunit E [archaeon]
MGLENVKKGLVQQAQAEAKKILSQADKLAEQTIEEAKENASKIRARAKERAAQIADAEANEKGSAAKLRAKKQIAEATNAKMDEALAKAWEEFSSAAQGKGYEKMMEMLIEVAEKELGGKAIVYVNERDEKIAKKFSKNVSPKAANISGGAIVSTADGRISIDNSLEAIFAQKKDDAKKVLYMEMFKERGE